MNQRLSAALVLAALTLTACGGANSYSDLTELRDAAVDAGLSCPEWNRGDSNSGTCSSETVMSIYNNGEDPQEEAEEAVDGLSDLGVPYTLLVGENWVINSPDAADLQDDMGGEVMTG